MRVSDPPRCGGISTINNKQKCGNIRYKCCGHRLVVCYICSARHCLTIKWAPGNRSPGVLTKAREIFYIAKGYRGVAVAHSRLHGGATPEPGKEESVCSLVSVETDPYDSL